MAVKGAILGDILCSKYERHRPSNYKTVPLISDGLRFTDDTVTTLAIKKAINEQLDLTDTMVNLCRKHINAGYGGAFKKWILSDNHRPYGSWGNGSAMRVSYIGEHYATLSEVREMAVKSAVISHDDIEGIKGAMVTANCVWMAKHGRSKKEIYDYILYMYPTENYAYSIENTMEELRDKYKWSVSCMDTVPVAMRCFYESTDYESFIRNVFSLDCDSDTFGAVAGGVAEEFYGGFGDIDADAILKLYLTNDLYEILVKGECK